MYQSAIKHLRNKKIELFFLIVAVLPHIVISLGNTNTILDWYSSDDGFYYFQVARNLAEGHGFTFDGLNKTNGFHPLWLFLITPIFALAEADPLLPLRLLVVLSALVTAATAILLYRIAKVFCSYRIALFVGFLWIVVPSIHDVTMHSGVEAGLNAFTILLFWHGLVNFSHSPDANRNRRALVILGLLGSLTILARLDNVLTIGFGSLWLLLRIKSPDKRKAKNPATLWSWRFRTWAAFLAPIGIIMLVYVAWNVVHFGTVIPVSGQVKAWWGTLRNTVYGFPVRHMAAFWGQFFTDDPELGPWSLFTSTLYRGAELILGGTGETVSTAARRSVLLILGISLAGLFAIPMWVKRNFFKQTTKDLGLFPFFLGCFAQISYYKISGSVAQQPWYWVSEVIFLLLSLAVLLEGGWRAIRRFPSFVTRVGPAAMAGTIVVVSIFFLGFIQSAVRLPGDGSNHFYFHRPVWLQQHTEPGARIAITGAGNLAYFTEGRTIINMDGLINSYDYFLALESGRGADFLAQLGVDYIFGNEYILTETNPYEPMLAGYLQPYATYIFGDRELQLWRFVPNSP